MELKQENDALKQKLKGLLIVPYGIETQEIIIHTVYQTDF